MHGPGAPLDPPINVILLGFFQTSSTIFCFLKWAYLVIISFTDSSRKKSLHLAADIPERTAEDLNESIHITLGPTYHEQLTALFTKPPSSVLPAFGMTFPTAGPIHGLRDFQELFQAKSWNGQEP